MDRQHAIAVGHLPEVDLSGDFGRRVLRLLAIQVDRSLDDLGERGPGVRMKTLAPPEPRYLHYFLGTNAFALAVLARAGDDAWPGVAAEDLLATSADCVEALVATHPLAGGAEPWDAFSAGRFMFHLATAAVLLGEALPAGSREAAGRILAPRPIRFWVDPRPRNCATTPRPRATPGTAAVWRRSPVPSPNTRAATSGSRRRSST